MMFGSTILEVAIGLLFVYLLLSLLCSAIGEYVEATFNNRAKYLRKGITLLLNDTAGGGVDLASQLYAHGLVRPFYRDGTKLPSYIPSRTFALALWNIATSATAQGGADAGVTPDLKAVRAAVATHLPNHELKVALLTLIDEAQGDVEKARKNVEEWYDGMMDRVSGWYKRRTTVLMLLLGFGIAAVVNADTINIANTLARDGALRSSLVAEAERRLSTPPAPTTTAEPSEEVEAQSARNLRQAYDSVNTLGLPIGWTWATAANQDDRRRVPNTFGDFLLKLVGIILTGFAISQGAPFWFDVLNKFMVVRSTVKPAEKSGEQPSKDKPAPKTPADAGETEKVELPKD
jgi:hypothetical protein